MTNFNFLLLLLFDVICLLEMDEVLASCGFNLQLYNWISKDSW